MTHPSRNRSLLYIAAETAKNYLGERSAEYPFGAIVTAIQAVWQQEQMNQATCDDAE